MIDLAVVLPCLNEADNLRTLLPRIHTVLSGIDAAAAVYVIDGGSKDDTVAVAEALGATVIPQRGTGYGGAIKTAFQDIRAAHLLTMDADFSHHPEFIKYLYARRHEAEIIIASRYAFQGHGEMPWTRQLLSGSLNLVFKRALSMRVRDLSSGFRLYHRNAISRLNLKYETYAVLQEILVKAYCEGYRVIEEPFHYLPRRHGSSHARVIQFGIVYLKALGALWSLRNSIESADYDTRAFFSAIPLQRWWQRRRYRIILEYLGDNLRVLDIGCGSTQLLNAVPQTIGMDIRTNKLRFMRRPGRTLINGSALALPFPDNAFDALISSQVIEHVPENALLFSEMKRCLAPGGALIIGTPDYGRWQWPLIEKMYALIKPSGYAEEHITHYTLEILSKRLADVGLKVVSHRYILGGELILKAVNED